MNKVVDYSEQRKRIKRKASEMAGLPMYHPAFPHVVTISVRNIKEILNQPHKHYIEKNESLLEIKCLFENSKFFGKLVRREKEDFASFLFEIWIAKDPSWIIVRKYDRGGDCFIYSISDQSSLLDHLEENRKRTSD